MMDEFEVIYIVQSLSLSLGLGHSLDYVDSARSFPLSSRLSLSSLCVPQMIGRANLQWGPTKSLIMVRVSSIVLARGSRGNKL